MYFSVRQRTDNCRFAGPGDVVLTDPVRLLTTPVLRSAQPC